MCGPKAKKGSFDYKLLGSFKLVWSNTRRMEFAGGSVSQKYIAHEYFQILSFSASHNTVTLCNSPVLSCPELAFHVSRPITRQWEPAR